MTDATANMLAGDLLGDADQLADALVELLADLEDTGTPRTSALATIGGTVTRLRGHARHLTELDTHSLT